MTGKMKKLVVAALVGALIIPMIPNAPTIQTAKAAEVTEDGLTYNDETGSVTYTPSNGVAEVATYAYGDNITATLYSNGDLVYEGTDAITEDMEDPIPEGTEDVGRVIFTDGITAIYKAYLLANVNYGSLQAFDLYISGTVLEVGNSTYGYIFSTSGNKYQSFINKLWIGNGVQVLGIKSFYTQIIGGELYIPSSVTYIGEACFYGVTVESVCFEDRSTGCYVGNGAFYSLGKTKYLRLSNNLTISTYTCVKNWAYYCNFSNWSSIEVIDIAEDQITFGDYFFHQMNPDVETIIFRGSVSTMKGFTTVSIAAPTVYTDSAAVLGYTWDSDVTPIFKSLSEAPDDSYVKSETEYAYVEKDTTNKYYFSTDGGSTWEESVAYEDYTLFIIPADCTEVLYCRKGSTEAIRANVVLSQVCPIEIGIDVSDILPAQEETATCTVSYSKTSTFSYTLPKTLTIDADTKQTTYTIKASGSVEDDETIVITPIDDVDDVTGVNFILRKGTKSVIATVNQSKTVWDADDLESAVTTNDNVVTAPELKTGSWSGTLTFKVALMSGN